MLHTFGGFFLQPFPKHLLSSRKTGLIATANMFTFIVAIMYASIAISKMTAKIVVKKIDNLDDLADKHPDVRLYMAKFSFIEDHVKGLNVFDKLRDRIDFFPNTNLEQAAYEKMITDVMHGTHVIADSSLAFR